MTIEVAIGVGGVLSLLLGVGHCFFYRAFGWKAEFEKTSRMAAKVLYTIHVFLIPTFFFFAYASFFHAHELAGGSPLGLALSTYYSAFWLFRGIWQLTYLRPPAHGRIERFVLLHRLLTVHFFVASFLYGLPLASRVF